ncbi:LacI family DNA-binding transcriptional regulator [Sphingomonas abietis]|uniref:LacI family DNA-binding transcriptional regulator n=1 Tax=Sphingomonas abietis TaxID=3012344 RepID=A0ABY7NN31_9SPHN|nr:LacI family DNA-binding transcriptional regulator [Sphingomonas abietis]WBO21314.1 LacI family DNA-binding transcriptional regulator [Sphingomonas abietis]
MIFDGAERPVTSHDVARAAGVSQSAVSRAFTAGASISPVMRDKVRSAAALLGYQPNLLPRMMLHGRSGFIALVVGGAYNPFHAATLEAFSRALQEAGKKILLLQVDDDRALDAVVNDLAGYRVDGVVSALSILGEEAAAAISAHRIPVVLLNSGLSSEWIRVVETDNHGAGRAAARLMARGGGTRFAYVGAPSVASAARKAGFQHELAKIGMAPPLCLEGNLDHDGGYAAARAMLAAPMRPDAIFCVNDLTAIGVADAWRIEGGLDVPRDAQLVGFDNIAASAWPAYRLTTFDQNVDRMAAEAVRLLVSPAPATERSCVGFTLIERHSTAR